MDNYQASCKEELIQKCVQMGLDHFEVQDIIEEKGLYENSVNLVLDLLNKPNYVNPLKKIKMPIYP